MRQIVIVGAGECGARAAFALREKDFDGEITLIGAEPLLPYERPSLSKEGLAAAAAPKFIAEPDGLHRTVDGLDRGAGQQCDPCFVVALGLGLSRILSRGVPEEIAAVVAERHRQEGVEIICGAGIAAIEEGADGASLLLADGGGIDADLVVVGIGAVPNSELAEAAGLMVDNGIAVDERLCTSDPDILAAGDCCSFPLSHYGGRRVRLEAWRNAQDQGTLAAANLMGAGEQIASVPWFWSDQYELTLQISGLADGAASAVRRDLEEGAFILFHLDSQGRLIAASGIGPGNAVARDIRLAEMLIAAGANPDPQALASPEIRLRKLLAA